MKKKIESFERICDICNKRSVDGSLDNIKISVVEGDFANVPGIRRGGSTKRFDLCSKCYKEKIEKELVK